MHFKNKYILICSILGVLFISFFIINNFTDLNNENFLNSSVDNSCDDSCLYDLAFEDSDYNQYDCLKIKTDILRFKCLAEVNKILIFNSAVENNNLSLCNSFLSKDLLTRCHDNYYIVKAYQTKDNSYCSEIVLEDLKNACN